jgi:alcohol dehydrogenase class IV
VHCLNKTMQVPSSLVSFGVAEADLEDLAQDALQGKATVTNPCVVTLQEVVDIYRNAYIGDTNG